MYPRPILRNEASLLGGDGGGGTPPAPGATPTAPTAPPVAPPAGDPPAPPAPPGGLLPPAPGTTPPAPPDTPAADWRTSLHPSFNTDPSLRVFTGFETQAEMIEAMAKSYVETKKLVGAKQPTPPADGATPAEVAAWKEHVRKVTGAPADAAGYGDTLRPADFPEEMWSAEFEAEARAAFVEEGLTGPQAKRLVDLHAKQIQKGLEQASASQAAALNQSRLELQAEWGKDFETNAWKIQEALRARGIALDHPMLADKDTVKLLHRFVTDMGETKLPVGSPSSVVDQAQKRLQDGFDGASTSDYARALRGEFGQERQMQAAQLQIEDLKLVEAHGRPFSMNR